MGLSSEDTLVFCLFTPNTRAKYVKLLLQNKIKWKKLFSQKLYQDMLPYLYYKLGKLDLYAYLPDKVLKELRKRYLANTGRNILFLSELGKILKTFNEENISTLLLKSTGLLNTVYQPIGIREISDLDILIHPVDLKKSEQSLFKLGYSFLSTNQGTHNLYCKDIIVELHWDIVDNSSPVQKYAFPLDADKFWENAIEIKVGNVKTLGMCPDDLIIYLACHSLKESYSQIKWFEDIYEITRHYSINWSNVIQKAREFSVTKPVYWFLNYAHTLLNAGVPKCVLDELKPSASWVERGVFGLPLKGKSVMNWRLFLYYFAINGFVNRLKAVRNLLFYAPRKIIKNRALHYKFSRSHTLATGRSSVKLKAKSVKFCGLRFEF